MPQMVPNTTPPIKKKLHIAMLAASVVSGCTTLAVLVGRPVVLKM